MLPYREVEMSNNESEEQVRRTQRWSPYSSYRSVNRSAETKNTSSMKKRITKERATQWLTEREEVTVVAQGEHLARDHEYGVAFCVPREVLGFVTSERSRPRGSLAEERLHLSWRLNLTRRQHALQRIVQLVAPYVISSHFSFRIFTWG